MKGLRRHILTPFIYWNPSLLKAIWGVAGGLTSHIATLSCIGLDSLPIGFIYVRHVFILEYLFAMFVFFCCRSFFWWLADSYQCLFSLIGKAILGHIQWAITFSTSCPIQSIGRSNPFKNCLVLFQGTLRDATGIFPCDFVSVIKDLPQEEDTINWLRCYYHDDNVSSIR